MEVVLLSTTLGGDDVVRFLTHLKEYINVILPWLGVSPHLLHRHVVGTIESLTTELATKAVVKLALRFELWHTHLCKHDVGLEVCGYLGLVHAYIFVCD